MNTMQWAFKKAYLKIVGRAARESGMEIGRALKSVYTRLTT